MRRFPQKVHILGGGIAGLACAYFIKKKTPKTQVVIYEAASHLGGRCYSFYDSHLEMPLDNATHGILGANRDIRQFLSAAKFDKKIPFLDFQNQQLSFTSWKFRELIGRSIFNTAPDSLDLATKLQTAWQLFPFGRRQTQFYFSKQDLSSNLIQNFRPEKNDIRLGWKLKSFTVQDGKLSSLLFNKGEVKINPGEKIISTLDAYNYQKIFGGYEFEFNRIINIFYKTSVKLVLPGGQDLLGLTGTLADWLFVGKNLLAATISNVQKLDLSPDELARSLWKEICLIRGVEAAFMPAYRVVDYKRATIAQDKANNARRPSSAKSAYANLRLAGDWTLKNYPCCLDGAVKSALRAVKSL